MGRDIFFSHIYVSLVILELKVLFWYPVLFDSSCIDILKFNCWRTKFKIRLRPFLDIYDYLSGKNLNGYMFKAINSLQILEGRNGKF